MQTKNINANKILRLALASLFFEKLLSINTFEVGHYADSLGPRLTTDERVGLKGAANARTLGATENLAAQIVVEIDAAHARRFAVWHSRNGRTNRNNCAAGGTSWATFHSFWVLGVRCCFVTFMHRYSVTGFASVVSTRSTTRLVAELDEATASFCE